VLLLYSTADIGQQARFIEEIENEDYKKLAFKIIQKYAWYRGFLPFIITGPCF
jgi:hypothetical protein